jgi:hypothetical protein
MLRSTMMSTADRFGLLPLVLVGWLSCSVYAQPSSLYKETEVTHGGTIHGVVRLAVGRPDTDILEITKDVPQCGRSMPSPRLVIGKQHGVKNAVLRIEGIRQGKKFILPEKTRLVQEHCAYAPHVSILRLGSDLEICNGDPILHNVHGYGFERSPLSLFNIAQPIKGQRSFVKSKQLNEPGIIQMMCDAGHPWMSGYVVVTDNPYTAVTDDDGNFSISDIPPGRYVLKFWHEGVSVTHKEMENGKVKKYYWEDAYEESREVVISEDATIQENFTLSLR